MVDGWNPSHIFFGHVANGGSDCFNKKWYLTREKSCAKKLNQGGDPLWLLASFLFWWLRIDGSWPPITKMSSPKNRILSNKYPGWWFGTCFSIIYGKILPIDWYFSRWLKPPTRSYFPSIVFPATSMASGTHFATFDAYPRCGWRTFTDSELVRICLRKIGLPLIPKWQVIGSALLDDCYPLVN